MMRRKGSLYSLIDIAMMVTALDSNAAKHQVTSVTKNYPEVGKAITHLKFPGRGQRETPVGDIYTVVEFIMLLPGRHAAQVRRQAAELGAQFDAWEVTSTPGSSVRCLRAQIGAWELKSTPRSSNQHLGGQIDASKSTYGW